MSEENNPCENPFFILQYKEGEDLGFDALVKDLLEYAESNSLKGLIGDPPTHPHV